MFILTLAVLPAAAQNPIVQLTPDADVVKVGDGFRITISGAANQPVSVRTTTMGRTDWGPVVGWTDTSGRWFTTGQFEKGDLGDWAEIWSVGGKIANPAVHFTVSAPCIKDGRTMFQVSGLAMAITCDTAGGSETFVTRSDNDPFRTPDGRVVPARMHVNRSAEEYHSEIMGSLITGAAPGSRSPVRGDEAAVLIAKVVGPNALSEGEIRNVLSIIRSAFKEPGADSSATLQLLQSLTNSTDQQSLKDQIVETIAFVQRR